MNNDKIKEQFTTAARQIIRYRMLLFVLVLACLYGFLAYEINELGHVKANPETVSAQTKTLGSPHIDQTTVKKITDLKDNSVNVQALFNEARQNPFQE